MGHFRSNLRDLEFNLFEVFGANNRLGQEPFAEMDIATARSVLSEVDHLATTELADSFSDADRNPPVFDAVNHTVTLPESLKKSFRLLMDGEWFRLELPDELGGYQAPPSLRWAVAELLLGANPPAYMYMGMGAFAPILYHMGTPEQRKLAELMVEKQWGVTMVLTEPDAGSDVGAARTKAVPGPDGTWHIEGVKRFITSGEHDLAENIIHFVLARPVNAGPGTKGLSMFLVPKFLINPDGSLGERNGVYATNLEHKMGLKASTTCELTFGGGDRPAVGYLVGGVHHGIAQMFKVIEHARMLVGTKAIAAASTGYLNALEYAKSRVQGADLTRMTDKTAPRVTITHHPEIRRSLMRQKSYVEGLRALVLYAASIQDELVIAEHAGDKAEAVRLHRLNDLLLPLIKGCGSERAYQLLGAESLQTFGGSGYLQDYPLEQYVRDAKIDTLYEGTTAIQGMDLFFRKIVRNNGEVLGQLASEIGSFLTVGPPANTAEKLASSYAALQRAMGDVQAMITTMTGWVGASQQEPREIYKVGFNTTRLLLTLGDLIIGWLLLRQAAIASVALAAYSSMALAADSSVAANPSSGQGQLTAGDRAFYQGKVAAAQFFASTVLPEITAQRKIVEQTTLDLMDLPEAAF